MGSQQYLHKLLAAAGGPLAQLLHTSQQHATLLGQLKQCLPNDLGAALQSAALDRGCLRLGVASSAWATRLRFMGPQICRELDRQPADWPYGPVATVEVHVTASAGIASPIAPAMPVPLSGASRAHLEAVAQTAADPRLAAALRSLARSGETESAEGDV